MTTPVDPATLDVRHVTGTQAALAYRASDSDDGGLGSLSWRAPLFGVLSEDLGGFRELVLPSSVTRTLGRPTQIAQYNHHVLLASRRAGTLEAEADDLGVRFTIPQLADTATGQHVARHAALGDLWGASFTFRLMAPSYWASYAQLRDEGLLGQPLPMRLGDQDPAADSELPDDLLVRVLTEMACYESGPVDMPAYPDSTVEHTRTLAALELHRLRGIDVSDARAAMAERRLIELLDPQRRTTTSAEQRGLDLLVARELARPRYATT